MVRALGEAFFSPDGEVSPEHLDRFIDDVDGFISPASATVRVGLLVMLSVLRWSPLLYFRFRPFEQLSVDDRVHHLERLERSKRQPLPLLVVSYKTLLTMVFYEDEEQLAQLGYPGTERTRWKRGLPMVTQ
jgi:hypothetical protein